QQVKVASVLAPFEEGRLPEGETRIVAEPTGFRFVVPAGTRSIQVTAAQPTFVRLYTLVTLTPSPDALEPPFDAAQLQATLWRYPRYDEQSWVLMQAETRLALAPLEAKLAAQARLEPAPPPTPPPGATAQTLLPEGEPERQTILERVLPEEMAAYRWTDGYYTALPAGRPPPGTGAA